MLADFSRIEISLFPNEEFIAHFISVSVFLYVDYDFVDVLPGPMGRLGHYLVDDGDSGWSESQTELYGVGGDQPT